MISTENFELKEVAKPAATKGQLLCEVKYISVDPYLRGRMNEGKSYIAPWELTESPDSICVMEVKDAGGCDGYQAGDFLSGSAKWQQFVLLDPTDKKGNGENIFVGAMVSLCGRATDAAMLCMLKPTSSHSLIIQAC